MKNRELIERLRELPDEAEVRICGENLDERALSVDFFMPGNAVRIWVDEREREN